MKGGVNCVGGDPVMLDGLMCVPLTNPRWDLTSEANLIVVPIPRNSQLKIVGKRPPPGSTMDPLATACEPSSLNAQIDFLSEPHFFSFFWKPSIAAAALLVTNSQTKLYRMGPRGAEADEYA